MNRADEFSAKLQRVHAWMDEHGLEGVVLSRVDNFAWLGCGASNVVNPASETGVGTLAVTTEGVKLIANNIETERLLTEELAGLDLAGVETFPWHAPEEREDLIEGLAVGRAFAADDASAGLADLPEGFAGLRYELTPAEVERYLELGTDARTAMEAAARSVEPGMTEADAAGMLGRACRRVGITPLVVLVAADDRIGSWRHPPPKDNPIHDYFMLVLTGRRQGLFVALTRLAHFGSPDGDLIKRHEAVCAVDAAAIAATRPGRKAKEVFDVIRRAYRAQGFEGEWKLHHQGGAIGYLGREWIANPSCDERVHSPQAFAWNPSIRGTKSEDTILVSADGPRLITAPSEDWPAVEARAEGLALSRADILVK